MEKELKNIKVLFVVDNSDFIEKIINIIRREYNLIDSKTVINEADYRDSIISFNPDIIISDYSLAEFNTVQALRIRDELNPYLPLIFIIESFNQDFAENAIDFCAVSFILKNNLEWLIPAISKTIKRKLLEKEKEETSRSLNEINNVLDSFFNANKDLMFIKDNNFKYIHVNNATVKFFGKPREMILYKTDFDLLEESGAQACLKSDMEVLGKKQIVVAEENVKGRIYETTKFPIIFKNNRILIGAIIRDITPQKNTENELRERINELERFDNLAVDRELRIIELKNEVNELLLQLGEAPKYKIAK